ncbi:MAG: Elf1-like putative transcription elongation factor [Amphiamblys sp. WSBS2006]|nr:MAG: Elf1-like putative transcription elongation factor [Amphiamblys sp. WSBS2006]OIR57642.1 MAG: Elf1-like putative transcription elongation factor [Amphiamblys sp. WSBS2006]
MGKRKTTEKVRKRPRPKVPTVFNCPVCYKKNTVVCKIDKHRATVRCRECGAQKEFVSAPLDEKIDVYTKWVDNL